MVNEAWRLGSWSSFVDRDRAWYAFTKAFATIAQPAAVTTGEIDRQLPILVLAAIDIGALLGGRVDRLRDFHLVHVLRNIGRYGAAAAACTTVASVPQHSAKQSHGQLAGLDAAA